MSDASSPAGGTTVREQLLTRQLAEARAELEAFTYMVSHELKGPLHTIKGFVEIVLDEQALGRNVNLTEDLSRIRDAADTLQAQLDALLALSRMGKRSLSPTEVAMLGLQQEVLRRWAPMVEAVGGALSFASSVSSLRTDLPVLLELLGHLIENSVAFRRPDRALALGVRISAAEGCVSIDVSDNGIGVPPAQLEAIFQPFRKISPHSSGRGMGLAHARKLAGLLGGRIWAQVIPEGGLRLCLVLAAVNEREAYNA